jgi:heme peroxidase
MFPALPPFTEPTDQQIADLAGTMLDQGGTATDHPEAPAGFTFFGQFLDHDLTLDTEPQPTAPVNIRTLDNDRTGIFDLDSVYGDGPQRTPQLYEEPDLKHLKVGVSGFLNDIPDVPREANGTAILADGRNDENLIIAQLHAAFLRFHNRLIDEGKSFADAQRLTRWHYQWLIVHDYLPRIVGQRNVDRFLNSNGEFYKPGNAHDPVLPVEFAVAAFRFGHSQVRPFYRLNGTPTGALRIFSLDPAIPDLRGGRPVPEDASPDFSPRGEPRLKVSMVNIKTATPQINRFGMDAERGQSSEWEAVIVEKLRVLRTVPTPARRREQAREPPSSPPPSLERHDGRAPHDP